jgi:hypothetical protein
MRRHWAWPALATLFALAGFAGLSFLVRAIVAAGGNQAAASAFSIWSSLVAASAVVFALVFCHALPLATGWREVGVRALWPVAAYVVFAAMVTTFLWAGGGVLTQLRPPAVLPVSRVLVVLGLIAAAPAVLGLWLVHTRLRRISERLSGPTEPPTRAVDVLEDLLGCRRAIGTCLTVFALIVTIATVDSGAQRKAFLATGTPPERFPPEWVLLYGALFTALSLLLYVPAFVAWRTRCRRLIDELYPLPADVRPSADWVDGQARLTQVLGADLTVGKNLTAAFGILAPLATSVLAVAIPGLK